MNAQIRPDHVFTVRPALPEPLQGLRDLAYNLWWSWNPAAQDLFRRIDADAWQRTQHNPVAMLGAVSREQLESRAADPAFLADLQRLQGEFERYVHTPTWFQGALAQAQRLRVGYFSMEYGVADSVPLYSGGLGVLAGDHLKAASDLGVPLVAVGMLYRHGYFRQWIDPAGQQRERFPTNDFYSLPISAQLDAAGRPLTIQVPIGGRAVRARLWRMDVGRVPVIFLDADLPENTPEDRLLTAKLYQGDSDVRIRQEALLGVGGLRALEALGMAPTVIHMNEGHSAFLVVERLRAIRAATGLSREAAWQVVRASTVFTTHTPVAAGHDSFTPEQIEKHLGPYLKEAGLSPDDLLRLGRVHPGDAAERLGMTVLAMRGASWRNGVSAVHGQVSRKMWQRLWPEVPVDEVPVRHVTNGVHLRSWVARELAELFERYIGPDWAERTDTAAVVDGIQAIPDEEFWRVHVRRRERLIANVRSRLRRQVERHRGSREELAEAATALHADVLTVGFARRFAVYKRPTLLLHDLDQLRALLADAARPVQIIYAGKAHPDDQTARDLVREIVALSRDPTVQGRLVFVEDYDMGLARDLVQGCDVWLNNPVRPLEASGTSGMKAAANGGLNLSVLDGWWAEAYTPEAGWAIGRGETDEPDRQRDASDAAAIYHLLERTVAPLFYEVGREGYPAAWIQKSKAAMALAASRFSANRLVRTYAADFYAPAHDLGQRLLASRGSAAAALADWLTTAREQWHDVRVLEVQAASPNERDVGSVVPVRTRVTLNGLKPDDVVVQVYMGRLGPDGGLTEGRAIDAKLEGRADDGSHWFAAQVRLQRSGSLGLTVRVLPRHPHLAGPFEAGLVRWSTAPGPS